MKYKRRASPTLQKPKILPFAPWYDWTNLTPCQTGSDFLTTILILTSSLEPYVSIPRSLPRMSPRMSHRMSHRMSKYLFPLQNDDYVVILFATYLSPIWYIYRGSRALFNRQSSHIFIVRSTLRQPAHPCQPPRFSTLLSFAPHH